MSPATSIKNAGILHLLMLGYLLPALTVSEQTTVENQASTAMTATSTGNSVTSAALTSLTATSNPTLQASTTANAPATAASTAATTDTQPTATDGGSTTMSQSTTMTSSSSTVMSTSASSTDVMNGTTMSTPTSMNMTQIYCPSFNCSYYECYSMYINQNATLCSPGECCQLWRSMEMWYTASCTVSCAESCFNTSQTNCSVNCCNSTGCLSDSFASMMMTTTVATTATTRSPQPETTTTTSTTTEDKGNKCHMGTCTGETCYTGFKDQMLQTCSSAQPHCQLKKETINSALTWTAGCGNCTGQPTCKTSTQPPCHLECCNATMSSSCLMLNGTLNVPSSATRGPYLHSQFMAAFLCLLAISLLL